MDKIIFVSVHPIHYNDYLFNEIAASGIPLSVYYSNKSLKNYPWKQKMNYNFPSQECNYKLGMDWGPDTQRLLGRIEARCRHTHALFDGA